MSNKNMTILIVDDEIAVRDSMKDFFEDTGFSVFTAETGESGYNVMQNNQIDIAIVDVRLPGESGCDFILRVYKISNKTVYYIHTGSIDFVMPPELKALGMDDDQVIYKPVQDLFALIDRIKNKVGSK